MRRVLISFALAAGPFTFAGLSFADATLPFQGRLTDATGAGVQQATLIVQLFDAVAATTPVVTIGPLGSVQFRDGLFSLSLTLSEAQMELLFGPGKRAFLQILATLPDGKQLSLPRQELGGVPLALRVPVGAGLRFDSTGKLVVDIDDSMIPAGVARDAELPSLTAPGAFGEGTPSTVKATAIRLPDADGTVVTVKANAATPSDYTLTLPTNDGNNGNVLFTDGNGNLSWAAPSGGGDMFAATYDGAGGSQAGVVDNAEKLNGRSESFLRDASNLNAGELLDARIPSSIARDTEIPTALPPSGAAGGALSGSFPNPGLAADAVTSAKIADGTIVGADINTSTTISVAAIGIGTATPADVLHVKGLGAPFIRVQSTDKALNDVNAGLHLLGSDGVGFTMQTLRYSALAGLNLSDSTGFSFWNMEAAESNGDKYRMIVNRYPSIAGVNGQMSFHFQDSYTGALAHFATNTANKVAIRVAAAAGQTANLQNWVTSDWSTVLAAITATGGAYFSDKVGIGTATPGSALDVNGTIRLRGSSSGFVGLAPAASAGSTTYVLPANAPSANGQVLSATTGGVMSWATPGGGGTVTSIDVAAPAAGITSSGGPITSSGTITLSLADDVAALEGLSGAGVAKRTGANTWSLLAAVPVADGGTGATDASTARTNLGLALGTDVQGYDADLGAVAAMATNGLAARTGAGAWTSRSLTAGSTKISVTNGDGVSGNPTVDVTEANLALGNIGGTLGLAKGGTGATSQAGAANAVLPAQGTHAGKVLTTNGSDVSWTPLTGDPSYGSSASSPNDAVYVNDSGQVGIGTTNPTTKLEVASTSSPKLSLFETPPLGGLGDIGEVTFAANSDGGVRKDFASIRGIVQDEVDTVEKGALAFQTVNNGAVGERMRINAAGNVGIGTTSPASNLHVKAPTGAVGLNVQSANETDAVHLMLTTGFNHNDDRKTAIVAPGGSYSRSDLHFVLNSAANSSDYVVGTDTKMIIRNDGNVGIGTTTPTAKLDVSDSAAGANTEVVVSNTGTNDSTATLALRFAHGHSIGGSPTGGRIVSAREGVYSGATSTWDSNLAFYTAADRTDNERMRITSSGNVGIGTTTPNWKLSVAGGPTGGLFTTSDYNGSTTGTALALATGTNSGNTYGSIQVAISGGAGTGDLLLQSGGGRVGIGTSGAAPTERLDLAGGNIAMGWERVENSCGSVLTCTATCTGSKRAIGGSCAGSGSWTIIYSSGTDTTYVCNSQFAPTTSLIATVYCANIR